MCSSTSQYSPGQVCVLQEYVAEPVQFAPPFAACLATVLVFVPPPQVTLQAPNGPHMQGTGAENKKVYN